MKGQIIVLVTLFMISSPISAAEDEKKGEELTSREAKMLEAKKEFQSPYYEAEFTQDSYYQASRDIASFKTDESK